MKLFIRFLLLAWVTSLYNLTDARVKTKIKGTHSHRGTQTATKHENLRDKRAVNSMPWSMEAVKNEDQASLYTTFDAATGGLGKTRNSRAVTCAKRRLPSTCATNMDCSVVRCNLLFARKKGSVTFKVDNCRRPSLTARIRVRALRINWSHTFTSNKQPPVLIPKFSYDMGVMQGGMFLKARLHRKTGNRLGVKVKVLVGGRIPEVSSYLIGTKLLHLSFLTNGKKCGKMPGPRIRPPSSKGSSSKINVKKPSLAKMGFPCANMKLSQFCKISSDCLRIKCAVHFAGQKVSLRFGINKCDNPISLTAGITVTALNINFKQKIKGGTMIPIPGFGVNVGVMKAGVFIVVGLKPKGSKLALQIRLKAGASMPFVGKVYPLKLTLLNVKLPIKVKGCGAAAQFMSMSPNLSQISSTFPSPIQRQPKDWSDDERMDPREEPAVYGGHSWENSDGHTARENRGFYEYQEMGPDDPIIMKPSMNQPYGANDVKDVIKGYPLVRGASYDTWETKEATSSVGKSEDYEEN